MPQPVWVSGTPAASACLGLAQSFVEDSQKDGQQIVLKCLFGQEYHVTCRSSLLHMLAEGKEHPLK